MPKTLFALAIAAADMVIVVTDHSDMDYRLIGEHAKIVFDTKNVKEQLGEIRGSYVRL